MPPVNPAGDQKKVAKKSSCKRKLSPSREDPSHKKIGLRSSALVHIVSPLTLMHVAVIAPAESEMTDSLFHRPLSSLAHDHSPEASTVFCSTPDIVAKGEQAARVTATNTAAEALQWSDLISIALGLSPQRTGTESPQLSKRDKRIVVALEVNFLPSVFAPHFLWL